MFKTLILKQQSRRILSYGTKSCLFRRSYKTLSAVKTDLEQWRKQRNQAKPSFVRGLIKNFGDSNQFSKAPEASECIYEQKFLYIFPEDDYASRLHLVESVIGLEEAEKFFKTIPENMRDYAVYDVLLRSYTRSEKTLDKAEATFEKMRDLGFLLKPSPFNSMISLYQQLNKQDMVDKLKRELMEINVEMESSTVTTENHVLSSDKCKEHCASNEDKKKVKVMVTDDEYRTQISNLLKLDDVEGAEKIYEEWKPFGPKLDMSIPELLISRFRAEGKESKVKQMVYSIRKKRIEMHFETFAFWLILVGAMLVLSAIMFAIIEQSVWLLKKYPMLLLVFCYPLYLRNPMLAFTLFLYTIEVSFDL